MNLCLSLSFLDACIEPEASFESRNFFLNHQKHVWATLPHRGALCNHTFLRELHGKVSAWAGEETSGLSWLGACISMKNSAKKRCPFRQIKIVLWPCMLWFPLSQITASLRASPENANPKLRSCSAAYGNGNSEPGLGKLPGRRTIFQVILHPEVSS